MKKKGTNAGSNPPPAGLGQKTRTVVHTIRFEQLLGEVISDLRETHDWNQSELAAKAGVNQSVISRIERGRGTRLYTLNMVAAAFGTSLSTLIARAERRWEKL